MKKKWIIIIAVAAVIAIGGSFLLIEKEEKKNSTVSGSPEIEKTLNAIKEKQSEDEEVSERHIVISNKLVELVGDDEINKIKELTGCSKKDDQLVLDTKYATERTKIKQYISDEVDTISNAMKKNGTTVSCNLSNGTITVNEGSENYKEKLYILEGLLGIYQRVDDNSTDWCVIVYLTHAAGSGTEQITVSDEGNR